MRLKVGIVGIIGAGKDTFGETVVAILNSLYPSSPEPLAVLRKFADPIHTAAKIAGFSSQREFKEEAIAVSLSDAVRGADAILDAAVATHVITPYQRNHAHNQLTYKLVSDYGSYEYTNELDISPRQYMIAIGEGFREYVFPTFWLALAEAQSANDIISVYTDVRYINEACRMDYLCHIEGRGLKLPNESERFAQEFEKFIPELSNKPIMGIDNSEDKSLANLKEGALYTAWDIYLGFINNNHYED